MALNAGIRTFKLVYANPALEQTRAGFESRATTYNLLWDYYSNAIFDMSENSWQAFRSKYGLYRNTRAIYNPTKRVSDFYADQVYPGSLSSDGENLPKGVTTACPFSSDTDKRLKRAIAQFWTWSGWGSWKNDHVLWGSVLGSVLVEIVDDVANGKVYTNYVWPGLVADLELDNRGNVKRYVLEYQVQEDKPMVGLGGAGSSTSKTYLYRKEVDQFTEKIYHNNEQVGPTIELPYGFCPAVWYRHSSNGSVHGQPAVAGVLGKINELNSTASQLNDQVGKVVSTPMGFVTSQPKSIAPLFGKEKRGPTEDLDGRAGQGGNSNRESQQFWTLPPDTRVEKLIGDLDIPGTLQNIDRLYGEIENDLPEITFWSKLRDMSQVTGPAAIQLSGDVTRKVQKIASLYDAQNIKLFQMSTAIAGFRANEGRQGWASPTRAQKKFKPFGLDSYARGELNIEIMPRPLVEPTATERSQEQVQYWAGLTAQKAFGIPEEMILENEGWTAEQIQKVTDAKAEAAQRQQAIFAQAGAAGQGNQPPGDKGANQQ
jgi:hypothetical protein